MQLTTRLACSPATGLPWGRSPNASRSRPSWTSNAGRNGRKQVSWSSRTKSRRRLLLRELSHRKFWRKSRSEWWKRYQSMTSFGKRPRSWSWRPDSRPSSTRNLFRRSRVSPCRKFRQNTSNSGDRPRIGVRRGQRWIRSSRTPRERPMKSDRTILLGTFPPSMTRYQF